MVNGQVEILFICTVRVFVTYLIIITVICFSSQRLDNYIVIISVENQRLQVHEWI